MVVKEQQKNKLRKGGKLEKVREDNLFVIEEILPNGNIMLQDMNKNLLKPFSIPMKHVKKIQIGELHSSETTHTMTSKMTDTMTKTMKMGLTDEMHVDVNMLTQNTTNAMTQEPTTSTMANMDEILAVAETQKSKIEEEEEMQNDTIFDEVVTPNEDETIEVNGSMLVESLNGTDYEDEVMEKIQEKYGYWKEDNIRILGQCWPSVIIFNPLNRILREEVGPLLRVTRFQNIGFWNIGAKLKGPARGIKQIKGDGNCYFQAVSFALAGNEEWHNEIRSMICDYIWFWPGKL